MLCIQLYGFLQSTLACVFRSSRAAGSASALTDPVSDLRVMYLAVSGGCRIIGVRSCRAWCECPWALMFEFELTLPDAVLRRIF